MDPKLLVVLCLVQAVWSERPNIILFVIDDLGWNDTGYQGAEYTTPWIDTLAAEGIRLNQHYVLPVCSPSRSSLLAGKYAYNLGMSRGLSSNGYPHGLSLKETTIAQRLKEGGYATHAVGKWDVGMHKWEYTPTYRGFDTFYGFYGSNEDYFQHTYDTSYIDHSNDFAIVSTSGVDLRRNEEPVTSENGTYSTYLFTKAIQDTIESHDVTDTTPFFVYGAHQAIHYPLTVPVEYLAKCPSIPYDKRKIVCGMLQVVDEGIKNVTDMLEAKGILDNTVIILITDNGGQTSKGGSNWPLRGNKATVFEGGVRGVGFVWGKMLPITNYAYNGLMHITDWYRTIVEGIAGIELDEDVTENLDGYNMWQALTQNEPSPRNEILLQLDPVRQANPEYNYTYFEGQAALRSGDWKLITGTPSCPPVIQLTCPTGWVHFDGTIEDDPDNPSLIWLFNITADPNERHNLADSFPEVVLRLQERIETYNSTHVFQMETPFDIRSDPVNFGGVWTPWLHDIIAVN